MNKLMTVWEQWGVFVGLLIALLAVFWIFLGSARKGVTAMPYKALSLVACVLVLPTLLASPTLHLGLDLGEAALPLQVLSMVGTLLSLVVLVAYLAGLGISPRRSVCPTCGAQLDPSWDYCPYCSGLSQSTEVSSSVGGGEGMSIAPTQGLEPFPQPEQVGAPSGSLDRTVVLREAPAGPLAWFILKSPPHVGKEFRLQTVTTVGRDPALNDIVLQDPAVSRQHAKVKLEEGHFVIYDLASENGTFVNGEKVLRQVLKDKDLLRFGQTEVVFMEIGESKSA